MGHTDDAHSDRKRKRRSRSRDKDDGSGSTSDSEEERHKGRKEKKEKKHKKHKKHKDGKDRAEREKDKQLLKEAKAFLKQQLANGSVSTGNLPPPPPLPAAGRLPGPPTLPYQPSSAAGPAQPPVVVKDPIDADQYFQKAAEFSTWLLEERNITFADLPSEDSRRLFDDFVTVWNSGLLAPRYYAGMVKLKRTNHAWGFAKAAGGGEAGAGPSRPGTGMAGYMQDERERRNEGFQQQRADQKLWKREQKESLDELLHKATGREGKIEARVARREEAKARASSPDMVGSVPGGGSLMGGDDSFEAAKAREDRRQQQQRHHALAKHELVASKVAAYQAKEDEKMAAFRALVSKGPITIAKRT